MPLKELFLRYVETQRSANDIKCASANPSFDKNVAEAYAKANELKRQVLVEIEKLQNETRNPE